MRRASGAAGSAPRLHRVGRRFESGLAHHKGFHQIWPTCFTKFGCRCVWERFFGLFDYFLAVCLCSDASAAVVGLLGRLSGSAQVGLVVFGHGCGPFPSLIGLGPGVVAVGLWGVECSGLRRHSKGGPPPGFAGGWLAVEF